MYKVHWSKRALKKVQTLPEEIRRELGFLIFKLQIGERLKMPQSQMMPILGTGCHELRVKGSDGIYRIFYFKKLREEILIFHAFKKKRKRRHIKKFYLVEKR